MKFKKKIVRPFVRKQIVSPDVHLHVLITKQLKKNFNSDKLQIFNVYADSLLTG